MSDKGRDFFDRKTAESYDERFRKISPIRTGLDFVIRIVLDDLPSHSRLLCVGVGTGTEIIDLANANPHRQFVGVEPSAAMLDVCRQKIGAHKLLDRCQLVHGYLDDLPLDPQFDAVLCLLVTQFVKDSAQRQAMFDGMAARLKPGGYLINAEISDDMSSAAFRDLSGKWKAMHRFAGAAESEAENSVDTLAKHVAGGAACRH